MFKANSANHVAIYKGDNYIDMDRDKKFDGSNKSWDIFSGSYSKASGKFSFRMVTTHPATEAIKIVLAEAGARPWSRDQTDKRIVDYVKTDKGKIIDSQSDVGGWGTLSKGAPIVDSDHDGMPDAWEIKHGANPKAKDHNGDVDCDGYTNLENYLHVAQPG